MNKQDLFQKELNKISQKHTFNHSKIVEEIKNNNYLKPKIKKYNLSDKEIAFFIIELSRMIGESKQNTNKITVTDFERDPMTKKIVFFERYASDDLRASVELLKNLVYKELGEPLYQIDVIELINKYIDSANWNQLTNYLKNINTASKNWLYIHGGILSGKSAIMSYIARIVNKDNVKIAFIPVNNIYTECIDIFNKSQNKFSEVKTVEFLIENLSNVNYLFLEDLGMEEGSTWFATNVLLKILEYRMKMKLPTFFSSTLNLIQLKQNYLQRIQKSSKNDSTMETIKIDKLIKIIEVNIYKTIETKESDD